jgi:hypothetical protein
LRDIYLQLSECGELAVPAGAACAELAILLLLPRGGSAAGTIVHMAHLLFAGFL